MTVVYVLEYIVFYIIIQWLHFPLIDIKTIIIQLIPEMRIKHIYPQPIYKIYWETTTTNFFMIYSFDRAA